MRLTQKWSIVAIGCLALTACGTSGPPAGSPATSSSAAFSLPGPVASGPSAARTAAGSAGGAASTPGSSSTGSAAGPNEVVPAQTVVAHGAVRVVVTISVGGGRPVPVVLDTGSSGLLINASALGSAVDRSNAQQVSKSYLGATLTGSLVQTTVKLGGQTTGQIGVVAFTPSAATTGLTSGEQGIMGIASEAQPGPVPPLWSPALQLSAPFNEASTLDVPTRGAGTWTLGPVAPAAGSVSVPLIPVSGAPGPLGRWAKDVKLCWTVDQDSAGCGMTDLDSGAPPVLLDQSTVDSTKSGTLDAGVPITIATPAGHTLWSFKTTKTATEGEAKVETLLPTQFNTGLGFYFRYRVSFDYRNGTLTLTPKS